MHNGWKAILRNGQEIYEEEGKPWKEIAKNNDILSMSIRNGSQTITLPNNMEEYSHSKTASADLSGQNVQIESRNYSFKLGNNMVRIRIYEKSKDISIEVSPHIPK